MSWKDWPYWLKGGIILGSIFLLSSLFIWAIPYNFLTNIIENTFQLFLGIPAILSMMTGIGHIDIMTGKVNLAAGVTFSLIAFIVYFIPGALLGWIYSKIKSKS